MEKGFIPYDIWPLLHLIYADGFVKIQVCQTTYLFKCYNGYLVVQTAVKYICYITIVTNESNKTI